jgi:hypothetical protein
MRTTKVFKTPFPLLARGSTRPQIVLDIVKEAEDSDGKFVQVKLLGCNMLEPIEYFTDIGGNQWRYFELLEDRTILCKSY